MTPCEEYWEALNALVDGECTPEEEAALRAHLAVCPGCRAALADLEAVQAVCEEWAGEPDDFTDAEFVDVPEGFAQRVLARAAETPQIRAEKPRRGRKSRSRGYGATWAALAACLALISSLRDIPVPDNVIAYGEVGLSGEFRQVASAEQRLNEAYRLGFTKIALPKRSHLKAIPDGVEIVPLVGIYDALKLLAAENKEKK